MFFDQLLNRFIASGNEPVPARLLTTPARARHGPGIRSVLHRGAKRFRVATGEKAGDVAQVAPIGTAFEAPRFHDRDAQRFFQGHPGEMPGAHAHERLSELLYGQIVAPALRPALEGIVVCHPG